MDELLAFLLNALAQFAGGPGPPENNLVRFGLAVLIWGTLLVTAWSRRRRTAPARENLLVLGFALGLFRELFKLGHLSFKLITGAEHDLLCMLIAPAEHILTLLSVVLISGAFLQYILDDAPLARRYLTLGLGASALAMAALALWWPQRLLVDPTVRFHTTWPAAAIHLLGAALIVLALVLLIGRHIWRHAVVVSLSLLGVSELFTYANFVTLHAHATILCPIGNAIYLVAIPLFGYVYYHEQQIEQQRTEASLRTYRDHLEELVLARTGEITQANGSLQAEIGERRHAERELARRNAELAAQNALAATISQSLELDAVLPSALEQTLDIMQMEYGCIFLLDSANNQLVLRTQRSAGTASGAHCQATVCHDISRQVLAEMAPVVRTWGTTCIDSSSPDRMPDRLILAGTPLIAEGHAVGTLALGATRTDAFSPQALSLLTAIGQQVGVAVEKAALHHQLELAATLEERQRIAAEMHDGLVQTLSYMGHQTDRAAELLDHGEHAQVREHFVQLRAAITQAGSEVRQSITSLQAGPAPRQSLQEAVRHVVADIAAETPLPTTVRIDDALPKPIVLPPAAQEQIVRVVQEALTNALHHAAAHRIDVCLAKEAPRIIISVQDDGRGFDPNVPATDGREHFGLSIMRARAARLGGALTVESTPGRGTCVTLALPAGIAPSQERLSSAVLP